MPLSPPGGAPGAPGGLPGGGPRDDLYDLDRYGTVDDHTDWQLWWNFNRDRFLKFTNIHTGAVATGSDEFYLGLGQSENKVGGRATDEVIDGPLAKALLAGLQKGGSNEFCQSTLVAMTKVGGPRQRDFDFVTQWFLANGTQPMHPTAAFMLGVTGDDARVKLLEDIALNTEAGCAAVTEADKHTTARVPMSIRAYAAYGLGMIGARSTDRAVRQDIVKTLVEILENDAAEANDARVAAMIALGLVPLHVDEDVVACYCGTCVVPDPHTSLRPQVTYLMRYFTAAKEFDPILRAHAATTLGRLVAARPEGMTERMKEGVAEVLIRSLEKSNRQPKEVRESAVLALGLIGDADNGNVDKWIRWALKRSLRSGGDMESRYALISLAETGGHPGEGEDPYGALGEIRKSIGQKLASGKKREKPWAALAYGVLGHQLRAKGVDLDPKVDSALVASMRKSKRVDDLGAYAVALGLRRHADAAPRLLKKLDRAKDEAARGYVAMSLGMIGAREAIEPLQNTLEKAEGQPLLQTRAGLALGMLGDAGVADSLLAILREAKEAADAEEAEEAEKGPREWDPLSDESDPFEATQVAAIAALGFIGDERGVDALCEVVVDANDEYSLAAREAAVVALGFCGDRSSRSWRTALTLGANYVARTKTLTSGEGTGVLDLR
ncbi:MAG: HEAT repeat domain-containing protein [Planctomycetota bacterium]